MDFATQSLLSNFLVSIHNLTKGVSVMSSQVQALVSQVALNTSAEAKASSALIALVSQVASLKDQLATAIANGGLQADDIAALTSSVSTLSASATALAAATPTA